MARFDTSGLDDLLADMTRLEQQTGPVAEAMTMAAAEVTKRCWQRAATEEGLIDTGAMIASISSLEIMNIGSARMSSQRLFSRPSCLTLAPACMEY